MAVTYKNAPLVELIAELRWGPATDQTQAGTQTVVFALPQSKDEEIFMQFGAAMSAAGYGRFERLIPPGTPTPYGQVAFRCRPTDAKKQAPLFQLGHGVFTANALPPYKSWEDFKPIVRIGIDSLIEAYDLAGVERPKFRIALIRYIDAFRDDLTGGREMQRFLSDVLGIKIVLPDAILSVAADQDTIHPALQLAVSTAVGPLQLKLAEGTVGNDQAVVMETSVTVNREIGADVEAAVAALGDGRQIIHELFRGLTASIHDAMEPIS